MPATLDEHYSYLSDRIKRERYEAAINRVIQPGDVALDLGCGSGLLGLMALRAGAGKVLFVEQGPVIEIARGAVDAAGFSDRAEFYQASSFDLTLSKSIDVVVCDHIGYFGFDYGVLELLADARTRFLRPGGTIIPAELDLRLALVESPGCRELVERWRSAALDEEFHWVGARAANSRHAVELGADDLVSEPAMLGTLQLGDDAGEFLSWKAEFSASRDATLDGLLGWFDCGLIGEIRMTNSPLVEDALERPQAYLPLDRPVTLAQGDRVKVEIMARPDDHVIAWTVVAHGQRYAMTTFNGLFLDSEALRRGRPDRAAQLNSRGLARQIVLGYCDGQRSVAEVESLVMQKHPDLFPSRQAAVAFVRGVLATDTAE